MDPISYGVAAKQKQRIEQVIANPDSTSGIVTTPSVIAVGETINIPAGRTAVLPNTTVNGTLVVDGEVFIPSGSSYTATNINVSGVGSRITGDFSNATAANRTKIQSSIPNGNSNVEIIPNGTASQALLRVANSSSTANFNIIDIVSSGASTRIQTAGIGTNPHTPLEFWTSGNEKLRIDTSGNVLVTGSGGLGYGTGAGGTVTQLTSKSTAVTLNKTTGRITMNNASLASGAPVAFQVNNSLVTTNDTVYVNAIDNSSYAVTTGWTTTGGFVIIVKNATAGALAEALQIQFTVTKGAVA